MAAGFTASCVGPHSIDSAKLPVELTVPPGAREISTRESPGVTAVSYQLSADFPATTFLSDIQSRLAKAGWQPLDNDWLNPSVPSSHVRGWTQFYTSSGGRAVVHQWIGDWLNPSGDILTYSLRYTSPASEDSRGTVTPINNALQVTAMRMAAAAAIAMQNAASRTPTH